MKTKTQNNDVGGRIPLLSFPMKAHHLLLFLLFPCFCMGTTNINISVRATVYNHMLRSINPPHYDVFFIDEDIDSFALIKDELTPKKGIQCNRSKEANIKDGAVQGIKETSSGIIIKATIITLDKGSAIVTGSWFSTSKASQSIKYWLELNTKTGKWIITKKKVLMTS